MSDELKMALATFDINGDGKIDIDEIMHACKLLKDERRLNKRLVCVFGWGALLALENEVLQALLRNRQSLTAAMDAMRMHDACDGIYDLLRAGLAMRRA